MEKKKLDRIIQSLREEMMTANPVGGQGGFGGNPTPSSTEKTRAGFNPLMGKMLRRKRKYIKLPPGSRKRWTPQKDES